MSTFQLVKPTSGALSNPGRAVIFAFSIAFVATERTGADDAPMPFWRPALLRGADADCLAGAARDRLTLLACAGDCVPIVWQLDERDAEGRPVLDRGPEPSADGSPAIVDENDEIVWMLEDAGPRRMRRDEIPAAAECMLEVRLVLDGRERWVYAASWRAPDPPRADASYVSYDPENDRITGARAVTGFRGATPRYFALRGATEPGPNLLDRLKVRAHARFFGILPLSRDEDDLETQFVAWKAGPIRVIRRQRQWVRLGWRLRTPIFHNDSFAYRDFAELPVSLALNFPPTYFFRGIEIDGVLDFRGLAGWKIVAARSGGPLDVDAIGVRERRSLEESSGDWFALIGEQATLIQTLAVSPSLATVTRRLVYRDGPDSRPPEDAAGEHPGVGYRLTDWGAVDRGAHWFTSTSYVVPAGYDVGGFLAERDAELEIEARRLVPDSAP